MHRLALPNKGRLHDDLCTLLDDAGLPLHKHGERALRAPFGPDAEAIFVRAQDVPELVADGVADAGITGADLVAEAGRPLCELLDLRLGACRLVVACRDDLGARSPADLRGRTRGATTFPHSAAAWFAAAGLDVDIVPLSGACEIAPHLGLADVVVDLVATGSTLRTNGLRELATIASSTARLYAREPAGDDGWLAELTLALDSVVRARDQRYLMANVPKDRIAHVCERLPGLNGPTLGEVVGGGRFVAMHAVVAAPAVPSTIAALRELGCQGILVTRIERLLP
ncbi:MAG: ATP phosphoribosyltransferase [Planctomycetota bacterium]